MATQMYDTGLENLKKVALTAKVRSFLTGSNGELEDVENPELSLDLQSLIDDPNFEMADGLFPELLERTSRHLTANNSNNNHHHGNPHQGQPHPDYIQLRGSTNGYANSRNPLAAYMNANQLHNGSTNNFDNPNNNNSVKEEPMDHRLDFNGNTVVAQDGGPNNGFYSANLSSNVTSPSSASSSSSTSSTSSGGGNHGYSPTYNGSNNSNMLTPATIPNALADMGLVKGSNFGKIGGTNNGLHHHGQQHHHHSSSSNSSLSKKMKNVDKASDEYKRRRERNNIAVRKSREKAKVRTRETEERVKILCKENERLQKKIDLLTEELTFLRSFFSNVGGLPEQIHREFNKHLETFQHHHLQNGIQ